MTTETLHASGSPRSASSKSREAEPRPAESEINSILQENNSLYYEGMSVPQRAAFLQIPSTTDNVHTLEFTHQSSKGGRHAYDFLTSWEQAYAAAPDNILESLFDLECGPSIGPQFDQMTCDFLHTNGTRFDAEITDDMDAVGGPVGGEFCADTVTDKVQAYEAFYGTNRTVALYGAKLDGSGNLVPAQITNAFCQFVGYEADVCADSRARYELTWESDATIVLVEMAGHLAIGNSDDATGMAYETGYGAAFINGGPYHFKLEKIDGISLGNQDNQIKGGDIQSGGDPKGCQIIGTTTACPLDGNLEFCSFSPDAGACAQEVDVTYQWEIPAATNETGATIVSGQNDVTAVIDPGVAVGDLDTFVVRLTKTGTTVTLECEVPVLVQEITEAGSIDPEEACEGESVTLCASPTGTAPFTYEWTDPGGNVIGTEQCVTLSDLQLSDAGDYCVLVTGACGSDSACAPVSVLEDPSVEVGGPEAVLSSGTLDEGPVEPLGHAEPWKRSDPPPAG